MCVVNAFFVKNNKNFNNFALNGLVIHSRIIYCIYYFWVDCTDFLDEIVEKVGFNYDS